MKLGSGLHVYDENVTSSKRIACQRLGYNRHPYTVATYQKHEIRSQKPATAKSDVRREKDESMCMEGTARCAY